MISGLTKIPVLERVVLSSLCCSDYRLPVMKPSWTIAESEGGKSHAENSEGGN